MKKQQGITKLLMVLVALGAFLALASLALPVSIPWLIWSVFMSLVLSLLLTFTSKRWPSLEQSRFGFVLRVLLGVAAIELTHQVEHTFIEKDLFAAYRWWFILQLILASFCGLTIGAILIGLFTNFFGNKDSAQN